MNIDAMTYVQSLAAIILVIGLIFATVWVTRRFMPQLGFTVKNNQAIQLQALKMVDPKTKIIVLEWKESQYLVALSDHTAVLLDKVGKKNEG